MASARTISTALALAAVILLGGACASTSDQLTAGAPTGSGPPESPGATNPATFEAVASAIS